MSANTQLVAPAPQASQRMLVGIVLAFAVVFAAFFDQGQLSSLFGWNSMSLHEFFHDARHLLGFPCH
jgi:Probable cobalt transporter subunit (CbtB)